MKINFTTKNINQRLYSRAILNYIYEHYHYSDYQRLMKQDKWTINIYPVSQANPNAYTTEEKKKLHPEIPHGVTEMDNIKCYILDIDNPMITLQNFSAIYHECAHMILKIYYPTKIVSQRNSDFWGIKGNKRKHSFWTRGRPRRPAEARRGQMGLLRRPEEAEWGC